MDDVYWKMRWEKSCFELTSDKNSDDNRTVKEMFFVSFSICGTTE